MEQTLSEMMTARFGQTCPISDDLPGQEQLANILGHRSHRAFTPQTIAADVLQLLYACALSAPSKSDLQQADIIDVQNQAKRRQIEALIPDMPWIAQAPVFLVFCGTSRRIRRICEMRGKAFANDHLDAFFNAAVDSALVLMNFIRAAEAIGLACCPISVIRNHAATISELLKLPLHVFPVAGLCLGYAAKERLITPRLSLQVTTHTDEYDDSKLAELIDEYDQRRDHVLPFRQQRDSERHGESEFYGWSEDKARQVSNTERDDFGRFIRDKQFDLS